MKFDDLYNKVLEEEFGQSVQNINTAHMAIMRELANTFKKDKKAAWNLIMKQPQMYFQLFTGKFDELDKNFRSLGVDTAKIASMVTAAQELLDKEKRGFKVPVKRALPVTTPFNK